jgi:enediyne biosynthesis protein E4
MQRVQRTIHLIVAVIIFSGCSTSEDNQIVDARPSGSGPEPQAHPFGENQTAADFKLKKHRADLQNETEPIRPFVTFTDVTAESGLHFRYYGSPSDQAYMVEQNSGGIAVFDYDGDNVPDVFMANGSHFKNPAREADQSSQYFRGLGDCHFESVTRKAGLELFSFGMGACAGDFDNDGFSDLFVACFGKNILFHNQGDGTFLQVPETELPADKSWSCSPAFADLDGNGTLDLYVVNYVDWNSDDAPCNPPNARHLRRTCSPTAFSATPDQLFKNVGDGVFQEVGSLGGIADKLDGKGLAMGIIDVDHDGKLDIYVANDATANSLFVNRGDLTFSNLSIQYGVAVSQDGIHGASMGVGIADFDRDGKNDIFVTNFRNQVNDLFQSLGDAGFVFANSTTGLDLASRSKLSFGTIFRDFNGDSFPDIFIANGHIWDLTSLGPQFDYKMQPSLMLNEAGHRFRDVSEEAGSYFKSEWLGRSVASGDLDNDADLDLVIQHIDADAVVLRNDSSNQDKGVIIRFVGTSACRDPLGCRVEYSRDGRSFVEHVPAGESFQASLDSRIVIPGTEPSVINSLRITWPTGETEQWDEIEINERCQLLAIQSGSIFNVPLQ